MLGEALLAFLLAWTGIRPQELILCREPSDGQSVGSVAELPVTVEAGSLVVRRPRGRLHPHLSAMLTMMRTYESLLIDAGLENDLDAFEQALLTHPLVRDASAAHELRLFHEHATARASLIRQIADCRRLRGDVAGAERDLRDATADLQARGLGETTEGIACRLDYAHCGYLAARPRDSLDRLLDIKSVCEQTQFAAEWWYRFSKTQRQLWNVDEAVTAARRCMTLAQETGSALANVKGRWAELAAQRLSVPVCDCNQSAEILAECAEVKCRFGELGYRAAIFVRHDIADLRRMSGDHERAAEEFRRIRELTQAMGETNREAHSWLGEAECVRAAAGGLGEVGGAEHLALYEQARSRYRAMDNLWGTAVSCFGLHVARGEEIRITAAATLGEPCCMGEQKLVTPASRCSPKLRVAEPMIVRFHHIAQTVVDLHESIGELEQMGYVPFRQFRSRSTDAEVVLMTHPNGVGVELFKFADPDMPAAADMGHHIALESTDLERDLGVRLEGGAKLVRDVSEGAPVRRFCFIRDTAGNLIELVEPWAEELAARSSR